MSDIDIEKTRRMLKMMGFDNDIYGAHYRGKVNITIYFFTADGKPFARIDKIGCRGEYMREYSKNHYTLESLLERIRELMGR